MILSEAAFSHPGQFLERDSAESQQQPTLSGKRKEYLGNLNDISLHSCPSVNASLSLSSGGQSGLWFCT